MNQASHRGYLEIVQELLQAGADPNISDEDGMSPLIWASSKGHLEIVQELLRPSFGRVDQFTGVGTNPNIANRYGVTPLYWASYRGNLKIVPAKPGAKRKNFFGRELILIRLITTV